MEASVLFYTDAGLCLQKINKLLSQTVAVITRLS